MKYIYSINSNNYERGSSLLVILLILGIVALFVQSGLINTILSQIKEGRHSTSISTRQNMLFNIGEELNNGIMLSFSRYDTNSDLERCIKAIPSPCDEGQTYNMILYAPILQQSFQGGEWPPAPSGAVRIAGGKTTNVTLYQSSGGRCPNQSLPAANDFCPIQAIVTFKPLCGGSYETPTIKDGGPCTGPAFGVDITVGIAYFMNNVLIYRGNTAPGGDSQVFRFSSNVFKK